MTGQVMLRETNQKTKTGKKVFVVLGIVGLDETDIKLNKIYDGFKYDVLDISINNGEDFKELNDDSSLEDLLERKIWNIK
jgi:hypothetical protein